MSLQPSCEQAIHLHMFVCTEYPALPSHPPAHNQEAGYIRSKLSIV